MLPRLDVERSFPDASLDEVPAILGDVWDTIVSGVPVKPTAREQGARVNPANLAKSLGKSRVLHWKDADNALAYNAEFGTGNVSSGVLGELRRAARLAAVMETFGPNPETMLNAVAATMQRRLAHDPAYLPHLTPEQRTAYGADLKTNAGPLRHALDIATGLISRPVNVTAAKIGSGVRAWESMSKLGAALFASIGEPVAIAAGSQFRGSGFAHGFATQIAGMMKGRPKGEQQEIAALLNEGFDSLVCHITSAAFAQDAPLGKLAEAGEKYFKATGLGWWTDVERAVAGRSVAAEMGMRAQTVHAELPAAYRHVLGLHGIDAARWEAIRFVMQFKGFPIAFTQRVAGRALFGHRPDASLGERGRHIGTLLAGLAGAGYASMTLKDLAKGYWPPRDPTDPKVMLAALQQGGALGIYGDFLFGQVNRFGGGPLETALGPTVATASDLGKLALETRDALAGKLSGEDARMPAAEALNLAISNTPYANLFYVKPALDALFLNSLRETVSPGYMRWQERNRERDFGQGTMPFLGDRRAVN